MALTIEITPEVEIRLEIEAKRSGMSKAEFAKNLIEEKLSPVEERPSYTLITPKFLGETKMRDFSGDDAWLRKHREEYAGQYVALHGERLLAHGEKLVNVAQKARDMGFPDALLTYIEPLDTPPFAGV